MYDVNDSLIHSSQNFSASERHEAQCPMVIIECNADFEIEKWSSGAECELGWSAEEMLGKSVFEAGLIHAEDQYRFVDLISSMRADFQVVNSEWNRSNLDGNTSTDQAETNKSGAAKRSERMSKKSAGLPNGAGGRVAGHPSCRFTSRFKSKDGLFKSFEVACSLLHTLRNSHSGFENEYDNEFGHEPSASSQVGIPSYKFWAIGVEATAERARSAESASQLKSHFLANMSHEIRAPLGAILGFADLMAAIETTAQERQEFLKIIERNGRHLGRLIDDILDLSKVEAGKMEISSEMVNPMTVIEEVLGYVSRKASQNQVRMVVSSDPNVPKRIATDLVRFRQVVTNVVSNAVKFTTFGDVKIHMSMQDTNHLKILVRDSGKGIPESVRDQIFKPFSRGKEGGSPNSPSGHGLGLVLSRKLARILGGDLVLTDTKEGEGSEFSIVVSIEETGKSEVAPEILQRSPHRPEIEVKDLDGYEILVVDDSRDSQALMQRLLKRRGARVELASDGEEGLDKVRSHDWDVVLMDIQMPRVDGLEATKRLRGMGYKGVVIALTARAMNEERIRCFEAGCTDHFSKPVQSQGLIERIRALVPSPHSLC